MKWDWIYPHKIARMNKKWDEIPSLPSGMDWCTIEPIIISIKSLNFIYDPVKAYRTASHRPHSNSFRLAKIPIQAYLEFSSAKVTWDWWHQTKVCSLCRPRLITVLCLGWIGFFLPRLSYISYFRLSIPDLPASSAHTSCWVIVTIKYLIYLMKPSASFIFFVNQGKNQKYPAQPLYGSILAIK